QRGLQLPIRKSKRSVPDTEFSEMEEAMPKPNDPALSAWLTHCLGTDTTPRDEPGVLRVFIEECSTPDRCWPVIQRFEQAIASGECSSYSINESHAFFDPATQLVTVNFSFAGVFDPPEQAMPVSRFLSLLRDWMNALGGTGVGEAQGAF